MADTATGDTAWRATLSDETVEQILQGVSTGTEKQVYALSGKGKFMRWNYDAWEELRSRLYYLVNDDRIEGRMKFLRWWWFHLVELLRTDLY